MIAELIKALIISIALAIENNTGHNMTKNVFKQLLLIILLFVTSCSENGPPSTETSSDNSKFIQLSGKIKFLEQYVAFRRTYKDLSFVISFHNNSGGLVPGPSDWDITILAQIPKTEIELWTKGLLPTSPQNKDWMKNLPGSIDYSGISTWFSSDNRLVGVDERNAVIVYRNTSMSISL